MKKGFLVTCLRHLLWPALFDSMEDIVRLSMQLRAEHMSSKVVHVSVVLFFQTRQVL